MRSRNFTQLYKINLQRLLLLLATVMLSFNAMAQTLPLSFNFQAASLPAGLSTVGGTISTAGTIGSCTMCSPGRIEIPASTGVFQIDVPSSSLVSLNMKSSGASARTVTIKYKKTGDPDYTTSGTISVPQVGATFELVALFPALASSGPISIKLENGTGGIFHIHDILVEGSGTPSAEADILSFKISGQIGNEVINNSTGKVDIQVPSGTALSSVVPSTVTLSAGATISPTATTARDFSGAANVPYTVTAQNGTTTKNWTVKVTEVLSSAKEITGFILAGNQIGNAVINSAAATISVLMPNGSSLSNIVPQTINISGNASISPTAATARDFSAPVTYTVTAQDASTKVWTVTVTLDNPSVTFVDYEAEEAEFTGTVDNNHTGYTGTGFINFLANGENYILFNVCQTGAGVQTAKFRYAMGTTPQRTGSLFVNDVFVQLLNFAPTGAWTTWAEENLSVNLLAGMNRIKITWDSTDGPNLDKLLLSGTQCAIKTLTINTTNSGVVTLSPKRFGNKYFDIETVTLLAESKPNLVFNNWTGDLTGNTNPAQVLMNTNKTITGNFTPIATYTLQINTTGIGEVVLNPAGGEYVAGTTVTLTANPILGSSFQNWSGAATGTTNPTTVVMDANKSVTATFTNSASINFETPIGFASVNTGSTYPEFNGPVTGGQNAVDTFWVNSPADFDALAWRLYYRNRAYKNLSGTNGVPKAPLVIAFKPGVYPEGTSTSSAWGNNMMTIQEQGDLTIIGQSGVVLKWGFNIKRSWNILIRNINFQDYKDDGINIGEAETHHIWIDHCTVGHPTSMPTNTESPDGSIDSKAGASYITISWTVFRNSWKTSLVGHSDNNGSEDNGKLKITYYGNHFVGTNSRNPRVRFGEVHVLNNLVERIGLYGIAAAKDAKVVAEGNFYLNTRWPMYADRTIADFKTVYGNNTDNVFTSKTGNLPSTYLKQFNNAYDDSGLPVITAQINPAMLNPGGRSIKFDELNAVAAFDPKIYYNYTAFSASSIRSIIPLFAGADKVDFFTKTTTSPTITTTGSLTTFNQAFGTPSAVQTYSVTASSLTENLVITPPINYEVSSNGGTTWFNNASPLQLIPASGSVASTTISVRLNAASAGSYSGNITHTSAGATQVNLAVSGNAIVPAASDKLIHWPLTTSNIDSAAVRNIGIVATVPTFTNFYLSNGTTVPSVPAYSGTHGQAFGADAGGTGLWSTGSGGPGGSLKRNYYQEFKVIAKAGYTALVDSLILNAAFHNSSSGTFLGIVYSKTGFTTIDSTSIQGGGVNWDGSALAATAGGFASPISLQNRTTPGTPDTYRLAIAGATGVSLQPGETLTVRLYFSCSSSSNGRYAKLLDLFFKGSTQSTTPPPVITVSGSLNNFNQATGTPSATQTYTVSGANLTDNVTITAPIGYEVSDDAGTTWFNNSTPLVLNHTSGTLASTTITVRLNAATQGSYTGTISHTSTGATTKNIAVNGTTTNPPVLTVTANLTNFSQIVGTPSATQNYTVSGTDLTGDVTITPPAGYEVSSNGGTSWFNNVTALVLIPTSGTIASTTITVRLNAAVTGPYSGNITHVSNGITTINVAVNGITSAVPVPTIFVSASLTGFSQTIGSPSATQTYSVSGSDLTGNVIITPPVGYEVSADGGTSWFNNTTALVLSPTVGTLASTTITVRLNASSAGPYAGNISHTSSGAATINVPVNGNAVNPPVITVTSALTSFAHTVGTPSATQNYTISGTSLTANVSVTPPAGFEVSADAGTTWFTNALPLVLIPTAGTLANTTITVRMNAALAGPYSGNIAHTSSAAVTKNVAVSGTAVNQPVITVSSALSNFAQTIGTASATQTFTVSGTSLTANISITPPAGYEVSSNGGSTWFNNTTPLVLIPSAGTLATTTIIVRLNALTAGSYSGNISHTSTGAVTRNVAVNGTAINPPTVLASPVFSPFDQTFGSPSAAQVFTVQGSSLTGDITITAPQNFEISLNNVNWFGNANPIILTAVSGTVPATTIRVRMNAIGTGPYNGNLTIQSPGTTTKSFALTGNSHTMFAISPNPAKDVLTLRHLQLFTPGDIYIYNQAGRLIRKMRSQAASGSTVINISNLSAGMYTLEFRRNNERLKVQFVKIH
jgi:pectate lyase